MLTLERLRSLLSYDPQTGVFTRLRGVRGFAAGTEAGTFHKNSGYVHLTVDGKKYRAHRLAWFYVHGEWPEEIDHANGVRSDNRLTNLREATRSQNNANMAPRIDNASGSKGVSWDGRTKSWRSYITQDGRQKHLGRFGDKGAAIAAYRKAAGFAFGEFARA